MGILSVGYFEIGMTIVFAVCYYKAGEIEAASGSSGSLAVLWAGLSVVVSVVFFSFIGGGILALAACQIALLIGIAVVRVLLEGRQ